MTTPRRFRASLFVVCVSLLLPPLDTAHGQAPPPILVKELAVEGNRRVQEAVILGRVRSGVGSTFNPSALSEDLRAIFALGFFDDVQMRVEDFEGGVKVTFVVVERPFIRDLDFVGNKKVATSTLQEKIDLKLGSVYNPVEVQRARDRLKDHYEEEGYFEVQITPDTEKFADGDVRVVFNINEGRRITIDRIVIQGNKGLTDKQIKAALVTQERQFFILRGTIQRQRLDEDVERIVVLYNDHGYVQARVESHDVSVDREKARATITFTIVEGRQYHVGTVAITGVTLVPEADVRRQVKLKPGVVFSRTALRESLRGIGDLYSTIGRASAEINPKTEQSAATGTIDLTFEVTEGPEVYVERINITGNLRSQDQVLRREIPLIEGDRFTLQKLQRARQKLVNLGYFEAVNVTTQPGSDKTKIIVNVDVKERPTGLFSIGAGFSSVDSFVGTIDLSQRNFLGRGWEASVRLRAGAVSTQGVISFTDPWLFDRPMAGGFDLFVTEREFDEYDYDTFGGALRVSRPFAEFWRWHLGYRLTQDQISDVTDTASSALLDEQGKRVTSLVSGTLTRDNRDNVFAPTRGGQTSLMAEFAGLGGDSRFVKTIASTSYFQPIWFNHILSGRAEVGYGFGWADDPLPLFERFYLGGPNSIRGLKFRSVSPVDDAGVRIGGTTELLGNLEYIVPLAFGIRVAGFFDIGNVYGFDTKFDPTDTREAVGAGFRWQSPFGPIRLDYGVNLDRRTDEDFGAFHFSVGSPF
ncbi:MAG: outer membrane protein assembly factor BamA [Candidatus Rokubacteria bacterium]|nr:outer membrane protein assembly factor BamA [Candidatus Rokubacteria bacterium]